MTNTTVCTDTDHGRVPTEADMWQAEVEYKRNALREVRVRIATLYAERGEDMRPAEL